MSDPESLDGDLLSGGHLEGDIVLPNLERKTNESNIGGVGYDTLDEPILTSVIRDLRAIGLKLYAALVPGPSTNILLREWDLWGFLFLSVYIGVLLQGMSTDPESSRFTVIFVVICIGTAVVTYSTVFMQSANISTFQCVSVLGYCFAPQAIAVSIFEILHILGVGNGLIVPRLLLVSLSIAWSAFAAFQIMRLTTEEHKKVPVLGPVVLLYVTVGLLIAVYTYADY